MNTPRFSGAFQWGKVRRQLLALRDDVQSIRKVAGRNVTVSEYEGKGSVINVTRERGQAAPPAATGACCISGICQESTTEADCITEGGIYQGDGTTCVPDPCQTGACCESDDSCTEGSNHDDCVAGGGIYLGNGTTCEGVDCTCCGLLDPYTEVHFSGQVLGCSGGTVDLPERIWTKVTADPGCTFNPQEFSKDLNCSCQFNAYNCFPFVNVTFVAIDETGGCDDPFNFGFNYEFQAQINCDGTVYFSGSSTPLPGAPPCATAYDLTPHGPYDITLGPIDVTVNADSGDTSIQFRFMLSLG